MGDNIAEMERRVALLEAESGNLRKELRSCLSLMFTTTVERDMMLDLLEMTGLETVEGEPLREWWGRMVRERVQERLIRVEDVDPASAAFLLGLVDDPLQDQE